MIPPKLRPSVLEMLHESHPGIIRMKGLSRSYVWWPGIDKDVTSLVTECQKCQLSRASVPASPPWEWEVPKAPWSRIHIDFVGPYLGHTFLIVVDAYSRWVELETMPSTTSEAVIRVFRRLFSTHGLPDILVSDNGPQLTFTAFQLFLATLGIRHAQVAPFYLASNGLVERAVRSAKEALARLEPVGWQERVSTYLLAQHTTPCPSTNLSPAELLMGHCLRTRLDRLHPSYTLLGPRHTGGVSRTFSEGDLVFARNYGRDPRWLPGRVTQVTGPYSYRVQLDDGRTWRRHVDQLRERATTSLQPIARDVPHLPPERSPPFLGSIAEPLPTITNNPSLDLPGEVTPAESPVETSPDPPTDQESAPQAVPAPRRSERVRRRPAYLQDYACAIQGGRGVVSARCPDNRATSS